MLIKNGLKLIEKGISSNIFLNGSRRYRHEVSKAIVYDTKKLEDGSNFIYRVPVTQQSTSQLPPPLKVKYEPKDKRQLTDIEIKEMRDLRNQDPETWTRSKLAKKFNCSEHLVYLLAPAPKNYHDKLVEKQTEHWQRLGFKRQLIYINRQRRRAEW